MLVGCSLFVIDIELERNYIELDKVDKILIKSF